MRQFESMLKTIYPDLGMTMPKDFRRMMTSESHLEFVRDLDCCIHGHPGVDAHHVQFKSQGRNDYTAIPMVHDRHMELHNAPGIRTFEEKWSFDSRDALIATLIARILLMEGKL